jgi:hypothetical protein
VITITSSIGAYPTIFIHIFIFCYRIMFIHWPSMDFHLFSSLSSIKVHSIYSTTVVLIALTILLIQFENMIGANIKKSFSHHGSFGFYNIFWTCNDWLGLHVVTHYQWQSIDEKRLVDFVKLKFHWNENIEWHSMHLELNWILGLNWIGFKFLGWNEIHLMFNAKPKYVYVFTYVYIVT